MCDSSNIPPMTIAAVTDTLEAPAAVTIPAGYRIDSHCNCSGTFPHHGK